MKKIIILLAFFNITCNQKDTTSDSGIPSTHSTSESGIPSGIDAKIKEYINNNADDPSSYQPIKTELYVNISKCKSRVIPIEEEISKAKEQIEIHEKDMSHPNRDKQFDFMDIDAIKDNQKQILKYQAEIDLIKKGGEKIFGYVFTHKYRIKNNHGALVLKKAYVITNPELKIEYFDENPVGFSISLSNFYERCLKNS